MKQQTTCGVAVVGEEALAVSALPDVFDLLEQLAGRNVA
jgi:hypothetical protein